MAPKSEDVVEVAPDTSAEPPQVEGGWSGSTRVAPPHDELIGKTLSDTYCIRRMVGQGGMGRVYEAHHTRITNKRFAIKVLHAEFTRKPEVLARFQREAEAGAAISHANVVGVYDVDRMDDGRPFLVCEYLEGIDLAAHVRNVGKMPVAPAIHVARQVCEALQVAHEQGVFHRDVKPHNIFLVGDLQRPIAKLLDFGLSRFLDSGSDITKTGTIVGTPSYMAPEQARGERGDHRGDIYGVGAIVYYALTGKAPFSEATPPLTILAVMRKEPPRPRSLEPSIPEHLELLIQQAMAKNPSDRYQSVAELGRAIDGFAPAEETRREERGARPLSSRMTYSRASIEYDATDVETARSRLTMLFLLAVVALLIATTGVLTGAFRLVAGEHLQTRWIHWLILALPTLIIMPLALTRAHRFYRTAWNNSAKVLELLPNFRATLLYGITAYGMAAAFVRVVDSTRPTEDGANTANLLIDSSVFLAIGLTASAATFVRQKFRRNRGGGRWQRMLGPLLAVCTVLISALLLYQSAQWHAAVKQAHSWTPSRAAKEPTTAKYPAILAEPIPPPPASSSSTAAPGSDAPTERASHVELAAAMTKGVETLRRLATRYPDDPGVLRALAIAYGKKPSNHLLALDTADRVFSLSADQTNNPDLRLVVLKAALGSSEKATEKSFALMSHKMGSAGPDILYDLWLTAPKVRSAVRMLLDDPRIQARFSPALSIAYDLRRAASCKSRIPLLRRALPLGDRRSVMVLSSLGNGTRRGCGRKKRSPCKARCPKQAPLFLDAMRKISKRLERQ